VRAATSLIPFPGVSDVAGIAVSSFFRTIEEIKQGVKAIEESVEGLSPDVAVSSAENQIRILEHLLYRADVIGEDLGETVRMRGQLEAIWIDISTNLTKAIMPDLKAVLQALLTISRMIELISRNTPAMTDVIDAIQVALTVTFPAAAVQVAQMLDFLEIISELLKKSEVDIDANTLADIQKFLLNPIPDHVRYGGGTKFTPPAAAGAAGAAGAGGP
jgi:UDP:flavonoid glycosyltransferase YjiC (YdhE family)